MNELELFEFVTDNKLEWHWHEPSDDVVLFVEIYNLEGFNKLLGPSILDEDGIECNMRDGYLCFNMRDICEWFGIELENVFKKSEEQL